MRNADALTRCLLAECPDRDRTGRNWNLRNRAMFRYVAGAPLLTMCVPQLEMHPLVPGWAVPGAPVLELVAVQKSAVIPH